MKPHPMFGEYGLVYFVQIGVDGPVKIGFTQRQITDRLEQIRPTSPHPMRLLLTCAGTRALEAWEHKRFGNLRISGEWFRPAPTLWQRIIWSRNNPLLAVRKLRHGVYLLDRLEYAPIPGCRPGPQIASATTDLHFTPRPDPAAQEAGLARGKANLDRLLAQLASHS